MQKKVQSAEEDARARISAFEKEHKRKMKELQSCIDAANTREAEAEAALSNELLLIDNSAEEKIKKTKQSLKTKYENIVEKHNREHSTRIHELEKDYSAKTNRLSAMIFCSISYGIIVTVFTASNSTRFSNDVSSMFNFIINALIKLWDEAIVWVASAWSLKNNIPYSIINVLIPGILAILAFLIVFVGVILLIILTVFIIGSLYAKYFGDTLSAVVALVSLAIIIWFADSLAFISWNLIVVYILIQIIYVIARILLTPSK